MKLYRQAVVPTRKGLEQIGGIPDDLTSDFKSVEEYHHFLLHECDVFEISVVHQHVSYQKGTTYKYVTDDEDCYESVWYE